MAVEEPAFDTLVADGDFTLRRYAPLIVAEVRVPGPMQEATNTGFRLLADYIFGGNAARHKVAMTAPVTIAPGEGAKIAMTAPVTMSPVGEEWTVQFTMPQEWTMESLPVPNNKRVSLRPVPATDMAVLSFSGLPGADRVARKQAALAAWVAARGWAPVGAPSLARYDPPWTPWFMRRNEVMQPVARAA